MSALNLKEVEWWIFKLENEESSQNGCILLASLYTIRDHMTGDVPKISQDASGYSLAPAAYMDPDSDTIGDYGNSPFLQAIAGKDAAKAWGVVDELMDTLQVVNVRVYNSVLRKIREL